MATSKIEKSVFSLLNKQQLSDSNVFENEFSVFFDWNSYLQNKTGDSNVYNYLSILRIPASDSKFVTLIGYNAPSGIVFRFKVNIVEKTITYVGKILYS